MSRGTVVILAVLMMALVGSSAAGNDEKTIDDGLVFSGNRKLVIMMLPRQQPNCGSKYDNCGPWYPRCCAGLDCIGAGRSGVCY